MNNIIVHFSNVFKKLSVVIKFSFMSNLKIIVTFLFINTIFIYTARTQSEEKIQSDTSKETIKNYKLSVLDYNKLVEVKENINSSKFSSLFKKLLKEGGKALQEGTFSVMQKTQTPPSGTKHDYISIGPYWWPDSTKPGGLPWLRRDGEINRLTREGSTDFETKNDMFINTNALAMAYFFQIKRNMQIKL
ncbi:hypothetical protein GCM10023314_24510 [Algibacter agarivorans]|uniref:Alginate lyase domain-containing protein n=1 Tax=Algibacter agarivorans TaxID=1109741 RepID=A0ABP9GPY2_9FLAO